jgi:GNAT superfamily N-acetyltransferase
LAGVEVLSGPHENLPAVGLALVDDLRDVLVGVVEDLAKQEHGSFHWREALEQHEECHGQGVGQFSHLLGAFVQVGDDRLGQPSADIGLPASPRRAHVVDGQPGCCRQLRAVENVDVEALGAQPPGGTL